MKILAKSKALIWLVIANGVYFGLSVLGSAFNSLSTQIASIPAVGSVLALPFRGITSIVLILSKFSKIVLVIDVVLLIIFLIKIFMKRKQSKTTLRNDLLRKDLTQQNVTSANEERLQNMDSF